MKMRSRVFAITFVCFLANVYGQPEEPLVSEKERHLAINDPDKFAWLLFERVNAEMPGDPHGRVYWETWALANNVFADPNNAPTWPAPAGPARNTQDFDTMPLQLRELLKQRAKAGEIVPQFDPDIAQAQVNETRLNRATFDFVVDNELYNIDGQEAFFDNGNEMVFPLEAMETKAQWRRIEAAAAARYHTATSTNADDTTQLWGLTALHITTKDLPNWFWCTFEHKDNPGREAVIPDRDSHGLPESLVGSKWENYVLRGAQVDFTNSIGRTTLLANSQIEEGFQEVSSCITCHSMASIGPRPLGGSGANRLPFFPAQVGRPNPDWFVDSSTNPPTRRYIQTDFVWSLFRARRKTVAGPMVDAANAGAEQEAPEEFKLDPEPIVQIPTGAAGAELAQVRPLIRLAEAQSNFHVNGEGLTVVVFDTGLRVTHDDFTGRVVTQLNLTADNGGDRNNVNDGDGHGTNVTGIIAADGVNRGIAPAAKVIPIKVLTNAGTGSFADVAEGLQWVLDHREEHDISIVNLSLGDSGNYTNDNFGMNDIKRLIGELREARVAVVCAAGNDFFPHDSVQGMSFPAIIRESVSVGAVFDANEGGFSYSSGASCSSSAADQVTPFSQRLHSSLSAALRTDILAPGAPVTSSGIANDTARSIQHGTSQASPVTSGVILLLQEFWLREKEQMPTVDDIENWLRRGAVTVTDDAGAMDNVVNTNLDFPRVDAFGALQAAQNQLERELFEMGTSN